MLVLWGIAVVRNCGAGPPFAFWYCRLLLNLYAHPCRRSLVDYNSAFGSADLDGIREIVNLFGEKHTQSQIHASTKEAFYNKFDAELNSLFDELKSIKVVIPESGRVGASSIGKGI